MKKINSFKQVIPLRSADANDSHRWTQYISKNQYSPMGLITKPSTRITIYVDPIRLEISQLRIGSLSLFLTAVISHLEFSFERYSSCLSENYVQPLHTLNTLASQVTQGLKILGFRVVPSCFTHFKHTWRLNSFPCLGRDEGMEISDLF